MDRNLQILGLAKKAGLLAVGSEDTGAASRSGKARLVLSSHDASAGALRRARNSASICSAPHVIAPYSSFELGSVSGRGSPGTVAILETGLAARFMEGLAAIDPERFGEPAELLMRKTRAHAESKKRNPSGKRRTV